MGEKMAECFAGGFKRNLYVKAGVITHPGFQAAF